MIPKSFTLVNRTYRVEKMHKDVADAGEQHGDIDRTTAKVRIKFDNPDNAEHTFYHELAHAIFWNSTKPKLSKDENLVDSVGALLHQFMQTRKGELK